jgi:hypothetical protein
VEEEAPRQANWLRATGWQLALLAAGTTWYWYEKDFNAADWDFPPFVDRFNGKAVRFDNNDFTTNTLGHPLAGMGYYGMARVNGLSPLASAAMATATSAAWEWGLEWREQVSINDAIFTPVAGIALGEFAYQLGEYVNSAPAGASFGHEVAAWSLGLPRRMHDMMDGAARSHPHPPDRLGLSSRYTHQFRLAYQTTSLARLDDEGLQMHGVIAEAELIRMPGYMRPGRISTTFNDGNSSRLSVELARGPGGAMENHVRADADLLGYVDQDLSGSEEGDLHGHAAILGLNVAFRHSNTEHFGAPDQVAVAHLPGPRGGLSLAAGALLVQVDATAHPDFVAMHSLAYPKWSANEGSQGAKSVLVERGYYHGYGASAELGTRVSFRGLSVGGAFELGAYRSIQGLDREQDQVTRDLPAADALLQYSLWAGYDFESLPVGLKVGAGGSIRTGELGEVAQEVVTRRVQASAALVF